MIINKGDIVLFQGDSITDCGRTITEGAPLGSGYPYFVSSMFTAAYPEMNVKFINRGISGNRVSDLKDRWQEDCIDIQPNVLSILVGMNDTWRRYDSGMSRSVEEFKDIYRSILETAREKTSAKIMIMEPFLLPMQPGQKEWREDLNPKIMAVRELAVEFGVPYVPLDGLFAAASARAPFDRWTVDGVHPSPAGHALIAKAWLQAAGVEI